MKKRIMLLMVLTAAVLAGCSGKAGAADQTTSSSAGVRRIKAVIGAKPED